MGICGAVAQYSLSFIQTPCVLNYNLIKRQCKYNVLLSHLSLGIPNNFLGKSHSVLRPYALATRISKLLFNRQSKRNVLIFFLRQQQLKDESGVWPFAWPAPTARVPTTFFESPRVRAHYFLNTKKLSVFRQLMYCLLWQSVIEFL